MPEFPFDLSEGLMGLIQPNTCKPHTQVLSQISEREVTSDPVNTSKPLLKMNKHVVS